MQWWQVLTEKPTIDPEIVFQVFNFPVSNTLLMSFLITVLLIVFVIWLNKKITVKPDTGQNIIETIYEAMADLLQQITGNKKITTTLLPLIAALFIYVGLANLLDLVIPFLTAFNYKGIALFRSPTSDFNVPFSLAVAMILLVQAISIKQWGLFKHLNKYFRWQEITQGFKKGLGQGFIGIINFLVSLLDIITEVARVISLSVRLFGNMFAGQMLAIIILGFLAYGLPAVWLAMSLLVGVIQAMVFGSLTAAYYSLALPEEQRD